MKRRLLALGAGLAVAVGLLVPAGGAGAADDTLRVVGTDLSKLPQVTLTVATPPSLAGKNLPGDAWQVKESGKERKVTVTGLPSDPMQVVLVIDTSGSMRDGGLDGARSAAQSFVDNMPDSVQIAVVGFGSTPYTVSGFTADHGALDAAIGGLQASGETALYDGVRTATSLLQANTRRSIVVLTDGKDTRSTSSLDDAAAALVASKASFYGVALTTSESDFASLQRLADAAHGRMVEEDKPGALKSVYNGIASELSSQYDLTFTTTRAGSTGFTVRVSADGVTATGSTRLSLPLDNGPTAPAQPTPAKVEKAANPGWTGETWFLAIGLVVIFLGLAGAAMIAMAPRERRSQLAGSRRLSPRDASRGLVQQITHGATGFAERSLAKNDRASRLNLALERAGIAMRPAEFTVLVAAATFAGFAVGLLFGGLWVALVLGGLVVVACRLGLSYFAERRRNKFADQLEQTLPLMAGSLRAGFGLMQAVDAVARESQEPTSEEFRRLVVETRLGRDLTDALGAMANRVGNEDFRWVVQAIEIHRQVGGDLAEVLDNVYATIRDRNRIRRQIQALSGEGRLSAAILFVLPIAMVVVISIINPGYLSELTDDPLGIGLIVAGCTLLALGGLWLRRITRLVF